MKKKNYFEECMKVLSVLKEDYGRSLVWHINEATKNNPKIKADITDEELYRDLLEHKENQTIYHKYIEEDSSIARIYQEGMDLNKILLDDEEEEDDFEGKNKF